MNPCLFVVIPEVDRGVFPGEPGYGVVEGGLFVVFDELVEGHGFSEQ
ncbi:MAG: hypothetical protein IPJ40_10305 [Saprospirales bacterium]|nr:hypothetical protein [Saprospirales bacterium]